VALAIPITASQSAKNSGLEVWMDRVLERADRARDGWDVDAVHDLRVALRRCRTIADALNEVNPGPGWRKLKRTSRDLFHALGQLRDTQVLRAKVKKLGPAGDPVRKRMLLLFAQNESTYRVAAEKALDRFDRKEWRKLTRKLIVKSRFFPQNSVVYQRLALTRLNEAAQMYQEARRRKSAIAWHRLRIGLKSFRYLLENFLPQRYEVWADDLKRMQDLLGEVHDLDVLRQQIRRNCGKINVALVKQWMERIDRERKGQLQEFLAKTSGAESPWLTWRAGFQWGHVLVATPAAERRTA
jgi:CHAD domain-containing protein